MDHHAGRSSRMSGRQKGRRINQPTHAKTHGWAIMAGLSNCLSSASGKHRHKVIYAKLENPCQANSFFFLDITPLLREIQETGPWPRFSRRFPGDHGVATTPTPGRTIETTSAPLIEAMICEGDTISRLGGDGRPGVASGEFAVLAIDAPPLNMRGGMVPAEVVAPEHPINEATALECVAPLQTIVRSARPHYSPRQRLAPREGARWFAFHPRS